MNYLVAPRNYDRDYGRPTPGFGDMDEYGLPRGMSPETGKRDFLYQYLEQNKEVMGPKTQMFDRYADPADGTLIAADPSFVIPREVSPQEVNQINRRVISDYEKKKEMLRRGFLSPLLRGV